MIANQVVYLGIDPGSKHYAIAGLDLRGNLQFLRMINNTIWSTAAHNADLRLAYFLSMRGILDKLRPRELMVESFVVRGFGTNSIEMVGLMNGTLQAICRFQGIVENMVMPSSWKRDFEKHLGALDAMYKFAREVELPPHVVDAICLATYLREGKTFTRADAKLLRRNISKGASMLQTEYKIKPRKKRK
jgi:hypothetical protein